MTSVQHKLHETWSLAGMQGTVTRETRPRARRPRERVRVLNSAASEAAPLGREERAVVARHGRPARARGLAEEVPAARVRARPPRGCRGPQLRSEAGAHGGPEDAGVLRVHHDVRQDDGVGLLEPVLHGAGEVVRLLQALLQPPQEVPGGAVALAHAAHLVLRVRELVVVRGQRLLGVLELLLCGLQVMVGLVQALLQVLLRGHELPVGVVAFCKLGLGALVVV
mmetsp:Transcript_60616/g.188157  ORF Transcript_60616/g.188157 Transcript_60616/m.188157 type:complete len:224 (+) Transcript_60616:1-672(+)